MEMKSENKMVFLWLDKWVSRLRIHSSKPLVTCKYRNPCYTMRQEGEIFTMVCKTLSKHREKPTKIYDKTITNLSPAKHFAWGLQVEQCKQENVQKIAAILPQ